MHAMKNTMFIRLTDQKAAGLLHELEALKLIKILTAPQANAPCKLSDKYKGVISKSEGEKLNKHIQQMRSEWSSI